MSDLEIPFRVGQAFDVHVFSADPDRVLVLGGIAFPGERGLKGHSDADVIAHVCTDALLSASGLGDIGQMFPDADPALADADSVGLLRLAAEAVRAAGWSPGNVACSVVLDRPALAPVKSAMESKLSAAVGAPVSVTGRRTEGVGALGRGEGVAAWAVALVAR
ncbi:MAG: 2-C-methyl-D-erythritol 2,4-cyclodiphosphate synthase [Acidimicrobiaceae bacterium]|nr:2-C-methyl-D-erythritol 2,4-cyclodiphosphate synthase [Acidimicrobiia bacterium]MCY4492657.1 2-C-methyl-D-erythritol 2,4-cyclodiphosphate synthase [Acidimicrobiaceae bacterium]